MLRLRCIKKNRPEWIADSETPQTIAGTLKHNSAAAILSSIGTKASKFTDYVYRDGNATKTIDGFIEVDLQLNDAPDSFNKILTSALENLKVKKDCEKIDPVVPDTLKKVFNSALLDGIKHFKLLVESEDARLTTNKIAGTPDLIIYPADSTDHRIFIVDFKFGAMPVSAAYNYQLMAYNYLVTAKLIGTPSISQTHNGAPRDAYLLIAQPGFELSIFKPEEEDLNKFKDFLSCVDDKLKFISLEETPNDFCGFCDANHLCKSYNKFLTKDMLDAESALSGTSISELSNDDLSDIYIILKRLTKNLDVCRKEILLRLESSDSDSIGCLVLKNGHVRRSWTGDINTVIQNILSAPIDISVSDIVNLKGVSSIFKIIKEHVENEEDRIDIISKLLPCITESTTKPSLTISKGD